jgi:hypothetical protein
MEKKGILSSLFGSKSKTVTRETGRDAPPPSTAPKGGGEHTTAIAPKPANRLNPEDLYAKFGHHLSREEFEDFAKIQQLMLSNEEMVENLRPLEGALRKQVDPHGALTGLLRQREEHHGFSGANLLPLGILPSEKFLELTQLGYMPKDVGAGIEHGEFSHRLQWNAIMNKFESDMQAHVDKGGDPAKGPWHHTPLELYSKLGNPNWVKKGDEDQPADKRQSLLAYLMDQAGMNPSEGMRHPDQLVMNLRNDIKNPEGQQASLEGGRAIHKELPAISKVVTERFRKRQEAMFKKVPDLAKMEPDERKKLQNNPLLAGSQLALNDYALKKQKSGNFAELDPGLFIGKADKPMTHEEIAMRKKISRVKFGLDRGPDKDEKEEKK